MKEFWFYLKFVWNYSRDQKEKLIKYIFCNIVSVFISIIIPILSAKVIIYLTDNQFYQLIFMATAIFVVENLRNLVHYFARFYSQVIYREGFTKIQTHLGSEILTLTNQSIDEHSSGIFIQRLTNDTSRLADVFNILTMYITNIITDLGIFVAIFFINKTVFLYLVVMVTFLYVVEHIRVKKYIEEDQVFREKNEKVSGFVGEIVRGIRDIKMLNAEENFISTLRHKVTDLNQTRYKMQNIERRYNLLRGFLRDFTDLFLILLLVVLLKENRLVVANALILYNYSARVPSIVNYLGMLLDKIKDFNLSASRIYAILYKEEFPKETFGTKHLDHVDGNFEFDDVCFSYEEKPVLNHLNFKIHANETVAFVGKSGAGKSTIFHLLCKMYQITSGTIRIDSVDIKELDRESIRGNITIINQNPYIFNLSIRDNLKLVKPDLTEEEMKEACKSACLDTFIEQLPEQYDTLIGEGGVNLSGGQKQRLAIARALIQKTEIILFDEATSALDNETQTNIQKAIEHMKHNYTILIIAHRLSTIIHSDRILFLEDGKIEAEGTHEELLAYSPRYRQLYESELQKEEV